MSAARYWHTLKYLRSRQIFGRLWFQVYRPAVDLRPAPARRRTNEVWRPLAWRDPALLGPSTVTFLNVTANVATPDAWGDESRGRLWLYNLHYFDDLTSRGFADRTGWHRPFVERWIVENPPGDGAGWESYPTSLRITNWIVWALAMPPAPPDFETRMFNSLAVQTRWLRKRLETHLMGNHLWANAHALLMAGVFFDGPEADDWRRTGLEMLFAALGEQILPDGGHFERSPMYHAIVLEDVLNLVQLARVFPGVLAPPVVDRFSRVASRMLRWLRVMSHPDGQLSFFNDAAFGVAAPGGTLTGYAETLQVDVDRQSLRAIEVLPESGYVRLENDRATVLCDVAPVGPDYQPGHAHADTLSFELSIDGKRVIVNGGTSTYTPGPERERQRGTAAHNTVEVDGANSTDVWAAFRVARRARPFDIRTGISDHRVWAEGAHDGYQHRAGLVHRRGWSLEPSCLVVSDTLEGEYKRAIARFILHPDVASAEVLQVQCEPPSPMTRVSTTWHPGFGHSLETQKIEINLVTPRTVTRLGWS